MRKRSGGRSSSPPAEEFVPEPVADPAVEVITFGFGGEQVVMDFCGTSKY
jgi:hypothetical protein